MSLAVRESSAACLVCVFEATHPPDFCVYMDAFHRCVNITGSLGWSGEPWLMAPFLFYDQKNKGGRSCFPTSFIPASAAGRMGSRPLPSMLSEYFVPCFSHDLVRFRGLA